MIVPFLPCCRQAQNSFEAASCKGELLKQSLLRRIDELELDDQGSSSRVEALRQEVGGASSPTMLRAALSSQNQSSVMTRKQHCSLLPKPAAVTGNLHVR